MPRPGPRSYECVRRSWHSDRHQPIRGSLIQEIFRMAEEVHSSSTRKNREWQEKLPCVVLKVEEIMYSKANSEVEYMDAETLWDRANDAIDTIIRKDDVNESGELLRPCIEAALNLGCIPRRASRSQRHTHPGSYLSSRSNCPSREKPDCINPIVASSTSNPLTQEVSPAVIGHKIPISCQNSPYFPFQDTRFAAAAAITASSTSPPSSFAIEVDLLHRFIDSGGSGGGAAAFDGSIDLNSKFDERSSSSSAINCDLSLGLR